MKCIALIRVCYFRLREFLVASRSVGSFISAASLHQRDHTDSVLYRRTGATNLVPRFGIRRKTNARSDVRHLSLYLLDRGEPISIAQIARRCNCRLGINSDFASLRNYVSALYTSPLRFPGHFKRAHDVAPRRNTVTP